MRRVGYWISEKKKKKLDFEEHRDLFRKAGLDLIQIDLQRSLEDQGPFDLLVHKITDLFAKAFEGHSSAENEIQKFEMYLNSHPECLLLDPMESIRCILNRYTQYQRASGCSAMKDGHCWVPAFVQLDSTNVSENKKKLAEGGVTYPLVCKPILAHGSSYAHQMSIIFSENHLKDVNPPCVAQTFVNHNAILYKILVIGCQQYIIQRPSLKNLYPGEFPTISFDTQEVSKADSDHPLNAIAYPEDQPFPPDWVYLDRLGQSVREAMEMDLFGFDVIIDCKTGQYGVIDVNFFPGFETIENFFDLLLDHCVKVLDTRDRGKLVRGRLISPPCDPADIKVLNQLNLQGRNPQDSSSKGQTTTATSPHNDFNQKNLEDCRPGNKTSGECLGRNNNVIASNGED